MAASRSRTSSELAERQFSLAAALGVVTGVCVVFAISRIVGWWLLILVAYFAVGSVGFNYSFLAFQRCLWVFWDLLGISALEPPKGRQFGERLPEFLLKKAEVLNDR